jgi:hypothetical protein
MLLTILFCIISYMMASILVEQKIFLEVREWLLDCGQQCNSNWLLCKLCQLITCMTCTGFWCGVFIFFTGFNVFNVGQWDFFYSGLLGAASAYFLYLFISYCEARLREIGIKI